jgi:large subunit ribosomal protein L10
MAITKEKKKAISEKLDTILDGAESLVFVNFHGLGVTDEGEIRNALREAGVNYYVAKKTLVKRALDAKGYKGDMPTMEGELALVSGEDLVAPAREINNFAKKLKDSLSIQGGVFEGRYMNASEMLEIANIPTQQTLYAQVVNLINSPIQGFVMALSEVAKKKEATT